MHVLLCVGDDDADLGPAFAVVWRDAAPRSSVETLVLPDPSPGRRVDGGPEARRPEHPGVFVPLSDLGLGSVRTGAPAPGPLDAAVRVVDLVVVHVPVLDAAAAHEGRVAAAVRAAAPHAVPVVVVAGRSEVARREWSAAGISGVHEVGEDPAPALARVARTWAPSWA